MLIFREYDDARFQTHSRIVTIPVLDRTLSIRYVEKVPGVVEEGILSAQFTVQTDLSRAFSDSFVSQIFEYLQKKRTEFHLTLYYPKGFSSFFLSVYRGLIIEAPYGSTISYSTLAKKIKRPSSARAVGLAMRINPWPIFVPCHRVVTKSGDPGGYQGGVANKLALLELEQQGVS